MCRRRRKVARAGLPTEKICVRSTFTVKVLFAGVWVIVRNVGEARRMWFRMAKWAFWIRVRLADGLVGCAMCYLPCCALGPISVMGGQFLRLAPKVVVLFGFETYIVVFDVVRKAAEAVDAELEVEIVHHYENDLSRVFLDDCWLQEGPSYCRPR